jgi:hypothetical protein
MRLLLFFSVFLYEVRKYGAEIQSRYYFRRTTDEAVVGMASNGGTRLWQRYLKRKASGYYDKPKKEPTRAERKTAVLPMAANQ